MTYTLGCDRLLVGELLHCAVRVPHQSGGYMLYSTGANQGYTRCMQLFMTVEVGHGGVYKEACKYQRVRLYFVATWILRGGCEAGL